MKSLKKTLVGLLILAIFALAAGVASVFLFKDKIIASFIEEANKQLNTPVKIGKIEVVWWSDFPNLALVFHNVYVEDSHPEEFPLLEAERLSFYLNPWDVWQGHYTIKGLQINNSQTYLRVNTAGKSNYVILKKKSDTTRAGKTIAFDLRNVRLINTLVSYEDKSIRQHHVFESDRLITSIKIAGDTYQIDAEGDITTRQIGIKDALFLTNKTFDAHAQVVYDDYAKQVSIGASTLAIRGSVFEVAGTYAFKDTHRIDLSVNGRDTDIQTLLSLLPTETAQPLRKYQSQGDVFLGLTLRGELSKRKDPLLSISFGCQNATIFHPDYQTRLENVSLEGSFATPSFSQFDKAELFLRNARGSLNQRPFEANFSLQNFADPRISFFFQGDLDVASLQSFYPVPALAGGTGEITARVLFEGDINKLKKKATAQQVRTDGSVVLNDVSFLYGTKKIPFKGLNGTLQFNNNDLALSNVSGQVGRSDFLLNGYFKNIITYFLFDNQPLGIETDIVSNYLDVDELLASGYADNDTETFQFSISPLVYLNLNCDVRQLSYKRFRATALKGDLLVKNQRALSKKINLRAMGGSLTLDGAVDAQTPNTIGITTHWTLKDIHIDSVFYVFENFRQDFIQDKHLRGQASAEVALDLALNRDLTLKSETLVADISALIKNGELNNFQPLQALSKYLDDEGLARLRFADLKNDIHIENRTLYIPQMEIKSNVTAIQLSGTHTFDQNIDYRIVAPLRSKRKIDPDEAFGAIEEDKTGQAKLFLKIVGTTDRYEVSYDKQAVRKKIGADLKKEVQELKDAFKLKGQQKKKELELTTEEFDWDN
ncbi:MAG: hypothetical protein MUC38_06535 [Cyclobacteriaceae bacterium]|nr:hypothetical protein [Cyclobacteriaceae bacterium]